MIRPIADLTLLQETHLDRIWKPEVVDGLKFDFQQNKDKSSIKGGVITMARKVTTDKQ